VARLASIQVGHPQTHVGRDQTVTTAFWKDEVRGSVMLKRLNLDGDRQADLRHHGGPDQAVLCYSADHYPYWRKLLALDMRHGAFGENFTIEGQTEWDVCVGDVYEIGAATIQISGFRSPCHKIGFRWDRPELLELVEASGKHGWYLRVLAEGLVEARQRVVLVERPNPDWTIRRVADVFRGRARDRASALALAEVGELASHTREALRRER
jgi:MOSC domain-containing protein YiiM